jgi:hypothetical protein
VLGATKTYQATLFFAKTLAIPCIQPMAMFCLTRTLFENMGTLDVVGIIVLQQVLEVNRIEICKVHLESWHVVMTKFRDLPMWPTIEQASVVSSVVVMHNEEGVFRFRGALRRQYLPHRVLFNTGAQPLTSFFFSLLQAFGIIIECASSMRN